MPDRARYRFGDFLLDPTDRSLTRGGAPVELSPRYFDALVLLVREEGRLVSKDRFLTEVWRGVPVTDEALTQCVRTLRRQLGDDATAPRFIETAPKHGYRFVAPVEALEGSVTAPISRPPASDSPWPARLRLAAAGTGGGALAGLYGGLAYGLIAAAQPADGGPGGLSVLVVLTCLTAIVGLLGGAGVAFGITAAGWGQRADMRAVLGGALGGGLVGAAFKLVGADAFALLFGRAPGAITGAVEGFVLGAAVGLGAWLATKAPFARSVRLGALAAAGCGAVGGILIALGGGRLMAGSLALLAQTYPDSRLRSESLAGLFGEGGFGPIANAVTAAGEGAAFAAGVVAALLLARRRAAR